MVRLSALLIRVELELHEERTPHIHSACFQTRFPSSFLHPRLPKPLSSRVWPRLMRHESRGDAVDGNVGFDGASVSVSDTRDSIFLFRRFCPLIFAFLEGEVSFGSSSKSRFSSVRRKRLEYIAFVKARVLH